MSKIRLTALPLVTMPQWSRRVRKLLPVPDLPKTPFERSTKRLRSRRTGTSMSSGWPISKRWSASSPKTRLKSASSAVKTWAKWGGMVRTGLGPSSIEASSEPSRASISIGWIARAP